MKTKWTLMFLILLGLLGSATLIARADDKDKDEEHEKKTSLDKIPAAAKDALIKDGHQVFVTQVDPLRFQGVL